MVTTTPPISLPSNLKTVLKGTLVPYPVTNVVIVSESWPSWLPITGSVNFHCLSIYSNDTVSRRVLSPMLGQTRWRSELDFRPVNYPQSALFLLSGRLRWLTTLRTLHSELRGRSLMSITFNGGIPQRTDEIIWTKAAHSFVGGVTAGSWFLGVDVTGFPSSPPLLTSSYGRHLQHIIVTSSPISGKLVSKPPPGVLDSTSLCQDDQLALHPQGLLPIAGATHALIRCGSVFSPTKWLNRSLTNRELGDAYDLPQAYLPLFDSVPGMRLHTLPFLRFAPSKLLRAFAVSVLSVLHSARRGVALVSSPVVELVSGGVYHPHDAHDACDGDNSENLEEVVPDGTNAESSGKNIEESAECLARVVVQSCPEWNIYFDRFLFSGSANAPTTAREKAATHDDAAVPVFIWNDNIWEGFTDSPCVYAAASVYLYRIAKDPLDVLRHSFFLPLWKRSVVRSWRRYYVRRVSADEAYFDHDLDRQAAADCLRYVAQATWWEWDGGSRLFFWRWPESVRQPARDGFKSFIRGPLPHYRVPQRKEKDEASKQKMIPKLVKVVNRGYMIPCTVKSLTSYFHVKKGDDDIRVVYDGTKSGLNGALWAPTFGLPNVESLLSAVEETTWMSDIDVGDMFLNFQLDVDLHAYCGVDLTPYLPLLKSWMAWSRCAMGLLPSPYFCIKFLLLAAEIFRGDRLNPMNPFRFDIVRMNLPGCLNYDPTKPWVSKIKSSTGKIAADVVQYVDDLRPTGESKVECTLATRAVSAGLGYLGIQDASRKRVGPSQNSGAWTGAIVVANETDGVGVKVTMEKWNKTKLLLAEVKEEYLSCDGSRMNHKRLQRSRGYLMYVTTTYPSMVPYMKGFHLTLDGWRPHRDDDGWKFTLAEIRRQIENLDWDDVEEDSSEGKLPPVEVKAANRLLDDVETLIEMTSGEMPPLRVVRSNVIAVAHYGFGDASGSGFGSSIEGPNGLKFRHGLWGSDGNGKSSNYRELCNLVETIEEGLIDGSLVGCELFIFTDNTVAEAAFYKGNTASSRLLFSLIVRLRKIEMLGNIRLWVIHVSGKRMIAQGTDALSRGNLIEGVMSGESMINFVSLSKSAFERCQAHEDKVRLLNWCRDWMGSTTLTPLEPLEWFNRGQGYVTGELNADKVWIPVESNEYCFIWAPPPAAGRIAVEQLMISRHKRFDRLHVFVCPRLFTSEWRKKLYKVADCVIEIPAGARDFWPVEMFEPLILGIVLPFIPHAPWQLKRSTEILAVERRMREVLKDQGGDERSVLRELLLLSPRKASV